VTSNNEALLFSVNAGTGDMKGSKETNKDSRYVKKAIFICFFAI
jgi:hypothetical protein